MWHSTFESLAWFFRCSINKSFLVYMAGHLEHIIFVRFRLEDLIFFLCFFTSVSVQSYKIIMKNVCGLNPCRYQSISYLIRRFVFTKIAAAVDIFWYPWTFTIFTIVCPMSNIMKVASVLSRLVIWFIFECNCVNFLRSKIKLMSTGEKNNERFHFWWWRGVENSP